MSDTADRRPWSSGNARAPADRLIDGAHRLFVFEPVAAAAGVALVAGALSGSGLVGFIGFVVAMLFASQLRVRHERDL